VADAVAEWVSGWTGEQHVERRGESSGGPVVPRAVRVRVPATSANLGPGFDALGLALSRYDEHEFIRDPAGRPGSARVTVSGEGAGALACDDGNLVVTAARASAAWAGRALPPFVLHCTNRIPHGLGLGSSAAAIVAGVIGGRTLSGLPRDEGAELVAAARLEGHPDNVAPAILGGFTIAWVDSAAAGPITARAARLEPSGFRVLAYLPTTAVSTAAARGLLPAVVPHGDAAHAAGRSALLVLALTGRADLLLPATEDRLHTQARGVAMPESLAMIEQLRAQGIAAVLSGAGPGVLALVADGKGEGITATGQLPAGWQRLELSPDLVGAQCTAQP